MWPCALPCWVIEHASMCSNLCHTRATTEVMFCIEQCSTFELSPRRQLSIDVNFTGLDEDETWYLKQAPSAVLAFITNRTWAVIATLCVRHDRTNPHEYPVPNIRRGNMTDHIRTPSLLCCFVISKMKSIAPCHIPLNLERTKLWRLSQPKFHEPRGQAHRQSGHSWYFKLYPDERCES
jgi:hypothetical protein